MPLEIVRNDITKMNVDAIVNAANSSLEMGGGVCGAIFDAAGSKALQTECDRIGHCDVGSAVITKGYNLIAKYIIHAVGPIWRGGDFDEEKTLVSTYKNALKLALDNKCKSIAFPLISSGIYGYPKEQALQVAVSTISEFVLEHDILVYLVVYDKKSFILSEKLYNSINSYIDEKLIRIENRQADLYNIKESDYSFKEAAVESSQSFRSKRKLEDVVMQLDETFSQMLLRLIGEKGKTDVETYKKANIDRKLFSKIRGSISYNPSKYTAIAFAIALELNLDEMKDLLGKAGYSLSHSNRFDIIIEYFIEEENYNIFEINEALFAYDQPLLGA